MRDILLNGVPGDEDAGASSTLKRTLRAVRTHLGLDVAYVSQIVDNETVFREVDAPGFEHRIKPGDRMPLEEVYCRHILDGRLPELIPDTSRNPFAASFPITKAVPIGAHMSVPIRLADGSLYGMFCCLGRTPDPTLNSRDLQMLRAFADLAAFEINRELEATAYEETRAARIREVIETGGISIHYQPIWRLADGRPAGVECLARFSAEPQRGPDTWFAEAAKVGLGPALELAAITAAAEGISHIPANLYAAVNVSPETVLAPEFCAIASRLPLERIALEITEHTRVDDYTELLRILEPLRGQGLRIAVDDAGAGYSSFQHILRVRPELIKLDTTLTRDIDIDPSRRALAAALIMFARETNARIVAEGIETLAELEVLKSLGADKAQGYFLARPMPLDSLLMLLSESASRDRSAA